MCSLLAGAVCAFVLAVVPLGGDAPAHVYRTLLVQHGVLVWDNLWFAGQYPLASYSLLYYLAAAPVGNVALGVAAVVTAAALFSSILLREWGSIGRWPARWYAVVAAAPLFTGDFAYACGFAALLGTIWALQRGRIWLTLAGATLTLGCSPLAFLLLCLTLLVLAPRRGRLDRPILVIGAAVGLLATLQLGVLAIFPSRGLYFPYGLWRLVLGVGVGILATALSLRGSGRRTLARLFAVWTLANIVSYFVPSAVGHNLLRPAALVFPLMLLAALLARWRPLWLVIPAVGAALAANVVPYLTMIPDRSTDNTGTSAYWRPLIDFLKTKPDPGFRVEVVPTADHWETFYLPQAGYSLARGWYTQLDIADNPTLFRPLSATAYRQWLRAVGVRYVVLPHALLGTSDGLQEVRLLTSGHSGLERVHTDRRFTVYELPSATPILTGPGRPQLTALTHDTISGRVSRPGSYQLRIRYTPYLEADRGTVCLMPSSTGMTTLLARSAGSFALHAIENPGTAIVTLLTQHHHTCPAPTPP